MDQASFVDYWQEAFLALIYDVHQMKPPITAAQINRCWKQELLETRFISTGIRHGAAQWLSDLAQVSPAKASALREALSTSTFHVGMTPTHAGLGAAGAVTAAAGGWMASHWHNASGKAGGIAAGLLGLGMMAGSGAELYACWDPERVCRQLRAEADKELTRIIRIYQGADEKKPESESTASASW